MSRIYSVGNTTTTFLDISDNDDTCIIVSVNPDRENEVIKTCKKVVFFKYNENFPFKIHYREPRRAGDDRVAFAAFAFYEGIYPSYLLDAGTFITVDYFDGNNLYPMATIPGFNTQIKTLQNAFNLRGLNVKKPKEKFPKSPEESLYNGIFVITGLGINAMLKERGEILITGGDATTLHTLLKRGVIVKNAPLIGAYMSYQNGII